MGKVVKLPNRSQAGDEAALWIARVDRGLSESELSELKEWLEADPLHEEAFLEMAGLWDDLQVLSELSSIFPLDGSASSRHREPRRSRRLAAPAIAAGVALLAVGALLLTGLPGGWTGSEPATGFTNEFRTAIGELDSSGLPDGSVLTLNTNTIVRVEYTSAGRNVFLEQGEAHFEVAHDPDAPFAVHVGDRIVRALGTAFSVQLEETRDIEVTVTDGRVSILSRNAPAPNRSGTRGRQGRGAAQDGPVVAAGQVAVVGNSMQEISRLEPSDLDMKLAWQRGMLIFQGEPLSDVLAEVNRYTSTPITLGDGGLGATRVGGYFRTDNIDALLVSLRENFGIESEVTADRIVLRERGE